MDVVFVFREIGECIVLAKHPHQRNRRGGDCVAVIVVAVIIINVANAIAAIITNVAADTNVADVTNGTDIISAISAIDAIVAGVCICIGVGVYARGTRQRNVRKPHRDPVVGKFRRSGEILAVLVQPGRTVMHTRTE